MSKEIPQDYLSAVVERPNEVSFRCTERSVHFSRLATTLNLIGGTKSVALSNQEMVARFGKWFKNNLKTKMKKIGLKVKIVKHEDTWHIWKTI